MTRLRDRLAAGERMSTRDFLVAALREYYASGPTIGAEGDFYTATNVSLFPHALRRFLDDAVGRLGGARVVELGGGSGALAAALGPDVTVVEPMEGLAAKQRDRGLHVVDSLAGLRPAPTVFVANEVLDALPVHRVTRTAEGWREMYVSAEGGRIVERPGPLSTGALDPALARLEAMLPPGGVAEVALDALALLDEMARAAPVGFALFLDYGGTAAELYRDDRPGGTLRGFRAHRVTEPFEAPGEQDVTSDVDFGWLEAAAPSTGWTPAARVRQGEFLADLGLVDDMMRALQRGDMETYLAAKNLVLPGGMGERFQAMLLARGEVPAQPPLAGFRRDIYPGPSRR